MEATEQNQNTVNKIVEILSKEGYTVEEAYRVLEFIRARIRYTSTVGYIELTWNE